MLDQKEDDTHDQLFWKENVSLSKRYGQASTTGVPQITENDRNAYRQCLRRGALLSPPFHSRENGSAEGLRTSSQPIQMVTKPGLEPRQAGSGIMLLTSMPSYHSSQRLFNNPANIQSQLSRPVLPLNCSVTWGRLPRAIFLSVKK